MGVLMVRSDPYNFGLFGGGNESSKTQSVSNIGVESMGGE